MRLSSLSNRNVGRKAIVACNSVTPVRPQTRHSTYPYGTPYTSFREAARMRTTHVRSTPSSTAASASSTEHSVLARQIAVWPNLIPYHSRPGGLSDAFAECSYCTLGRGKHTEVHCGASSPLSLLQAASAATVATYAVSCCSPQRFKN
jgi:hypothetical protein